MVFGSSSLWSARKVEGDKLSCQVQPVPDVFFCGLERGTIRKIRVAEILVKGMREFSENNCGMCGNRQLESVYDAKVFLSRLAGHAQFYQGEHLPISLTTNSLLSLPQQKVLQSNRVGLTFPLLLSREICAALPDTITPGACSGPALDLSA